MEIGEAVWVEIGDWRQPGRLVEFIDERVVVEFKHWNSGDLVHRIVPRGRVKPRGPAPRRAEPSSGYLSPAERGRRLREHDEIEAARRAREELAR